VLSNKSRPSQFSTVDKHCSRIDGSFVVCVVPFSWFIPVGMALTNINYDRFKGSAVLVNCAKLKFTIALKTHRQPPAAPNRQRMKFKIMT
jgi:hypothetical protein